MTNRKRVIEAKKEGYRSAIELNIAEQIEEQGQEIRYEAIKIQWIDLSIRTYTPDFVLDNGIIIEVKGRWTAHDRKKHLEIRKQHPHLDIRMVFENSRKKLYKSSKTTYALWCAKKDILFADRVIPEAWLKEKRKVMPPKLTRVINHN
jgi:hypothetical protein